MMASMAIDMTGRQNVLPQGQPPTTTSRPSRASEVRARLDALKSAVQKQTQSLEVANRAAATALEGKFRDAKERASAKDAAISMLTDALAESDLHMQRLSTRSFGAASNALSILQQLAGWDVQREALHLQGLRLVQRLAQVKETVAQAVQEAEKGCSGLTGAGAAKLQSVQLGLSAVEALAHTMHKALTPAKPVTGSAVCARSCNEQLSAIMQELQDLLASIDPACVHVPKQQPTSVQLAANCAPSSPLGVHTCEALAGRASASPSQISLPQLSAALLEDWSPFSRLLHSTDVVSSILQQTSVEAVASASSRHASLVPVQPRAQPAWRRSVSSCSQRGAPVGSDSGTLLLGSPRLQSTAAGSQADMESCSPEVADAEGTVAAATSARPSFCGSTMGSLRTSACGSMGGLPGRSRMVSLNGQTLVQIADMAHLSPQQQVGVYRLLIEDLTSQLSAAQAQLVDQQVHSWQGRTWAACTDLMADMQRLELDLHVAAAEQDTALACSSAVVATHGSQHSTPAFGAAWGSVAPTCTDTLRSGASSGGASSVSNDVRWAVPDQQGSVAPDQQQDGLRAKAPRPTLAPSPPPFDMSVAVCEDGMADSGGKSGARPHPRHAHVHHAKPPVVQQLTTTLTLRHSVNLDQPTTPGLTDVTRTRSRAATTWGSHMASISTSAVSSPLTSHAGYVCATSCGELCACSSGSGCSSCIVGDNRNTHLSATADACLIGCTSVSLDVGGDLDVSLATFSRSCSSASNASQASSGTLSGYSSYSHPSLDGVELEERSEWFSTTMRARTAALKKLPDEAFMAVREVQAELIEGERHAADRARVHLAHNPMFSDDDAM